MEKQYLTININKLKPHPKNPKDHDIEAIKASIERNGALDPIEIDENNIILSGHGTCEAMKDLGYEDADVIRYTGLTDEQKEDYILSANTTTMGRGFFDEKLKLFKPDTLNSAGFKGKDLDRIFQTEEDSEDTYNTQERYDEIKTPKTKHGDLYLLGSHRLLCGDSTKHGDVQRLMDGSLDDMVFTDPPYNVDYKGRKHGGIKNDNMSEEEFIEFTLAFMERMSESLKSGGVYYICSGFSSYPIFRYALESLKLTFSGPIIWVKDNSSLGWNDYRHKHEMMLKAKNTKKKKQAESILYGWNGGRHFFVDDRFESDVWEITRRAGNTMVHPTQKPIPMINRAIKNSTKRNESVLDLFGGSGSTLISAEKTQRKSYILELDPKYCDVMVERWEHLTGEKASKPVH